MTRLGCRSNLSCCGAPGCAAAMGSARTVKRKSEVCRFEPRQAFSPSSGCEEALALFRHTSRMTPIRLKSCGSAPTSTAAPSRAEDPPEMLVPREREEAAEKGGHADKVSRAAPWASASWVILHAALSCTRPRIPSRGKAGDHSQYGVFHRVQAQKDEGDPRNGDGIARENEPNEIRCRRCRPNFHGRPLTITCKL